MTNPRSRNFLAQAAHVSTPAQLPAINVVTSADAKQLADFSQAVKDTLDVRNGRSGNPFERWTTVRDLERLGLTGGPAVSAVPVDRTGIPVWTSQRTFVLVTLQGIAAALSDYIATADAATADSLEELRGRVDALASSTTQSVSVSVSQLSAELTRVRTDLAARWGEDIDSAVRAVERRLLSGLDTVHAIATQAAATAIRQRGYIHEITVAATTWTIEHNLGRYPLVAVWNAAGEKVEPDITYTDENTVVITHGRVETGFAVFR